MLFKLRIGLGILAIILSGGLLLNCGPSPEELAATAAVLTAAAATSTPTNTPTPTPTNTPTPTPTPMPYDLSVVVIGEEDAPIVGAAVFLAEIGQKAGTKTTDGAGQAFWYDLPGETVNLLTSAPGYFPFQTTDSIERGSNQLTVALERDPHGVLPSEACAPSGRLLYLEDFQDGRRKDGQSSNFLRTGGALFLILIPPTM